MAVSAVDQSFLDLMVEGRGELWLHLAVALEAKFGLLHPQQIPVPTGSMNDVTADATYIVLGVGRLFKVRALGAMAFLAPLIHLFGGGARGTEDEGNGDAFRVCSAGAVTALAGDACSEMD